MALPDELRSRKLIGLLLTFGVLILLFAAYVVASIWVSVSETVITAITSTIGLLGGAHQAAQSAQDRAQAYSPNYPAPLAPPPAAPTIEDLLK